MSYERKSVEVEAICLVTAIYDKDGGLLADKGEWVVVDGPQQFYMRDQDFKRHFALKVPDQKTTVEIHPYPVYIERGVPWRRHWWEQPYIWSSSDTYSMAHSETNSLWNTNPEELSIENSIR